MRADGAQRARLPPLLLRRRGAGCASHAASQQQLSCFAMLRGNTLARPPARPPAHAAAGRCLCAQPRTQKTPSSWWRRPVRSTPSSPTPPLPAPWRRCGRCTSSFMADPRVGGTACCGLNAPGCTDRQPMVAPARLASPQTSCTGPTNRRQAGRQVGRSRPATSTRRWLVALCSARPLSPRL